MVARIDVRSLVKRAKEECKSTDVAREPNKPCDTSAAETLRKHAAQQICLDLRKFSLNTEIQVSSLFCSYRLAGEHFGSMLLSRRRSSMCQTFLVRVRSVSSSQLWTLPQLAAGPMLEKERCKTGVGGRVKVQYERYYKCQTSAPHDVSNRLTS